MALTPEQLAAIVQATGDSGLPDIAPRGTLPEALQMASPTWQDIAVGNGTQAYPGQANEIPTPNDYWTRIAEAQGPSPFNFHVRNRNPNPAEVILGLAAAFGNFKTAAAANKAQDIERQNERVRQAGRDLALHRYQSARQRALAKEVSDRVAATQAGVQQRFEQGTVPVQIGGQTVRAKPGEITGAVKYGETAGQVPGGPTLTGKNKPPSDGSRQTGGPSTPTTVEGWVKLLLTNQATMSQVPKEMRNPVVDRLSQTDSTIIPPKARDAIQSINGGLNMVDELEKLSAKIPRGEGLKRFEAGLKNAAGAFAQTNPDAAEYDRLRTNLSNVARAMGERGVLTDQDVKRVLSTIPDLFTSGTMNKRQFATLRRILEGFKTRSIETYTTEGAGAATQSDPLGIR